MANQQQTRADRTNILGSYYFNRGTAIVEFKDMSSGTITSRCWDFGDGATSTGKNPSHVYRGYGSFTVRLTVSGPSGSDTETETGYVYNLVATEYVDNSYHEKPHYYTGSSTMSGKIICDTGTVKIPSEERRYLLGDTDAQILARLNAIEPIYEYYNFKLKPPSMR